MKADKETDKKTDKKDDKKQPVEDELPAEDAPKPTASLDQNASENKEQNAEVETVEAAEEAAEEQKAKKEWRCVGKSVQRVCQYMPVESEESEEEDIGNTTADASQNGTTDTRQNADIASTGVGGRASGEQGENTNIIQNTDVYSHEPSPQED